jgi:hypothetical protein
MGSLEDVVDVGSVVSERTPTGLDYLGRENISAGKHNMVDGGQEQGEELLRLTDQVSQVDEHRDIVAWVGLDLL